LTTRLSLALGCSVAGKTADQSRRHTENRASAFDGAERSYLQTARHLGCAEAAARTWASAVMFQLRAEADEIVPLRPNKVEDWRARLARVEKADGPDLGGGHRATWEVMRFQLDFAAQMLGHLFEGRDKIIACYSACNF
jgi:hypothetical protein